MTTLFKITITGILLMGQTIFLPVDVLGQTKSIFDLMNYGEILEMTIEANLDSLQNSRRSDEYQKAFLTFEDENKQIQNWKIKVRTRGKYRRRVCEMPPLKIKLKKSRLAAAGLNEFNDMKLVTHCVANKNEAKELLFKEYLAYRLYEELTPDSYRTQLVRITYKDINTGRKSKNWGFLIEDTAQLADRMNAEKCDCWGNNENDFEHGSVERVSLFQYMIGNEDYKLIALKNVKTLRRGTQLIPVPYDFDFSGLVNAPYAIANQDFNLNYVTDRVYLGSKKSLVRLHSTKVIFYAKEQRLKSIIGNFRKLDNLVKAEMTNYLDSFFQTMDAIVTIDGQSKIENSARGLSK